MTIFNPTTWAAKVMALSMAAFLTGQTAWAAHANYESGMAKMQAKDWAGAVADFNTALAAEGQTVDDRVAIHEQLIRCYQNQKQWSNVVAQYEQVLAETGLDTQTGPDRVRRRINFFYGAIGMNLRPEVKGYPHACALVDRALEIADLTPSRKTDFLLFRAQALGLQGKTAEMLAATDQAVAEQGLEPPQQVNLLIQAADKMKELSHYPKALELLARALEVLNLDSDKLRAPDVAVQQYFTALSMAADCYRGSRKMTEALDMLKRIENLPRISADMEAKALMSMAEIQAQLYQYDAACALLSKVSTLKDLKSQVYESAKARLAALQANGAKHQETCAAYASVSVGESAGAGDKINAWRRRAELLDFQGNYAEARTELEKILTLSGLPASQRVETLFFLALLNEKDGKYKEADEVLGQIVALPGGEPKPAKRADEMRASLKYRIEMPLPAKMPQTPEKKTMKDTKQTMKDGDAEGRAQVRILAESVIDNNALTFAQGAPFGICINGQTFQEYAMATYQGYQYATYFHGSGRLALARRKLPQGPWQPIYFDDYLISTLTDVHNVTSLGICPGDGTIHLAFDHHGGKLKYRVSKPGVATQPEGIAWEAGLFGPTTDTLVGVGQLPNVTYPTFSSAPDGGLLLNYRTGMSSNGDWHLTEYDPATSRWAPPRLFLAKEGSFQGNPSRCAYPHGLQYDSRGRLHVSWCWREALFLASNHDLLYAYSDDRGQTWRNNAGQTITDNKKSGIRVDSPGIEVAAIDRGWGMMNTISQDVDGKGRLHVMQWHTPSEAPAASPNDANKWRYYHYWRDEAGQWHRQELPFFGRKPRLVVNEAGDAMLVFNKGSNLNYEKTDTSGKLHVAVASAKARWTDWRVVYVSDRDYMGEPRVDTLRWRAEGILSVYVQQWPMEDGKPSPLWSIDFLQERQ